MRKFNKFSRKGKNFKLGAIVSRKNYISDFLPKSRTNALDLGCGDGSTLKLLESLGFDRIIGVDKINLKNKIKSSKINFFRSDIINFLKNVNKDKYDLITIFDVLEHIKPKYIEEILKSCFNSLKDGGYLIIQIPNGCSIFNGVYFYGDPTHIFTYNEYSMNNLLLKTGFHQSKIKFKETAPTFKSAISILRFILWRIVRVIIIGIHIIETGNAPKINTRTLICGAQK